MSRAAGQHRSAQQILVAATGNALPPLAAIVTAPVLASVLGTAGRGAAAAAVAPLVLAVTACGLGVPESLTFHVARGLRAAGRTTARMLLLLAAIGLGGSAAIAAASPIFAGGDERVAALITVAGLALAPSLVVYGLRGVASGAQRWRLVTGERLVSSVLRLVLVVGLALTHTLDVQNATAVLAVTSFAGGLVYLALLWRAPAVEAAPEAPTRELLRYSGRIWLGTLTGILLARLDQAIMLPLSNATQLGLYAVAVSVCETTLVINSAARDVLFTRVSAGDVSLATLGRASRLSTLATAACSLGIAAVAWFAVPFFFGNDFAPALPTIWVLLAAIVLGNPGSIAGAGLSGNGRPGLRSASLTAGLVANVVALLVLVPPLGAAGAAIATLAGNVAAGYGNILWVRLLSGTRMREFLGVRLEDLVALRVLAASLLRRSRAPKQTLSPATE